MGIRNFFGCGRTQAISVRKDRWRLALPCEIGVIVISQVVIHQQRNNTVLVSRSFHKKPITSVSRELEPKDQFSNSLKVLYIPDATPYYDAEIWRGTPNRYPWVR